MPLQHLVGDADRRHLRANFREIWSSLPRSRSPGFEPARLHKMLVVHGDADRVLPLEKTGKRLPGLIKDMQLVVIAGGPHAISWTHADQVNRALLDFVQAVEIRGTSPLKATASSAPN